MANSNILSLLDRISVRTVLTKNTGSYLGFLFTLIFIAICLVLLIPVIYLFHNGVYFQSQFIVDQYPRQTYYFGQDLIIAIAFRHRITNQYANHSEIIQNIKIQAAYNGITDTFKTQMNPCKPQIFKKSVNPIQVKDCFMIPFDLKYQIQPTWGYFDYIGITFKVRCQNFLNCQQKNQSLNRFNYLKNLNDHYYYEYIFTSKVADDKGNPAFQFHRFASSQYNSPDTNAQVTVIKSLQMKSYIDNSIMPWWNNQTVQGPIWLGNLAGYDLTDARMATVGFYADYYIFQQIQYAYRYYKKLDFLLGTIGGTIFLLFLIFWVPINFLNRTWQKINNSQSLYVDSDYYNEEKNDNKTFGFQRININIFKYLINCIKPGKNKQQDLINLGQHQVDIVKMIKKLKVAKRNLKVKNIQLKLKSKDLQLQDQQKQYQNQKDINVLDLNPQGEEILMKAHNTQNIYSTNPTALALIQSKSAQKMIMNDAYEKNYIQKSSQNNCQNFKDKCFKIIKFFDIFGVRPMFVAEPQNSSLCGFVLTLIIIIVSVLTFALTISNMNATKIVTNYLYQKPQDHNYQIKTGDNLRFMFCIPSGNMDKYFLGSSQIAKVTFFKYTKSGGVQQIQSQRMNTGQLYTYFQIPTDQKLGYRPNQKNCLRPVENQKIKIGGSFGTNNQAYFGIRVDPYCGGTPTYCQANKNRTITKFLQVINGLNYVFVMNQNKYHPIKAKIVPGYASSTVSQKDSYMNANLKRTEQLFVYSTELIQDKSQSFLRQVPKTIFKSASYYNGGFRNQQRKGDPNDDPAYILQIRPNGRVQQVILRNYKIDYLLGIIGGVFLFWYLIIHFFAKIYNSYKVRAKLAQVLYQQSEFPLNAKLLYMLRVPTPILCCTRLKQDVQRMKIVDQKIKRDLNYLNIVKKTDNIYNLSCSMYQKDSQRNLAQIYFRQKISHQQEVITRKGQYIRSMRSTTINQTSNNEFDSLKSFQQSLDFSQKSSHKLFRKNKILNIDTANIMKSQQKLMIEQDNLYEKQIELQSTQPLYNWNDSIQRQSKLSQIIKELDLFKNRPEYTLDGKRDIKSIFGGLCFFLIFILIVIVCSHFVGLYLSGADFTISYRRFLEQTLNKIDQSSTYTDVSNGINIVTGQNFKLAVGFFQRQHFYPHDVSSQVGKSIGVRAMQFTIKRVNNSHHDQTFVQTQFKPCMSNYLQDFMGDYDDPKIFSNLTYGYCIPDNIKLTISGLPQDQQRKYFKISVYNKYNNQTGKKALNDFLNKYSVIYYNPVPIMNFQQQKFDYQLYSFTNVNTPKSIGIEYNFTLSKMVYTNKYSKNSIQAFGDRMAKFQARKDTNMLSDQNTRNLTFTYSGVIEQYTLDYPRGGQLFGLVGGVIALFTFIIYSFVHSFNQYRMKYLIGKKLYSFYIENNQYQRKNRKKQILNDNQKSQKDQQQYQKINNFNQFDLFLAWMLTPVAYIKNDYNFNDNLRRITLIVQRAQNDLNLYNYLLKLQSASDLLNNKIQLHEGNKKYQNIKVTQVYLKKIYHPCEKRDKQISIGTMLQKIREQNQLSNYQIICIDKAIDAKVNPQTVLGNSILEKVFKQGINIDQTKHDKIYNMYNKRIGSSRSSKKPIITQNPSISNFEEIQSQQNQKGFNVNVNQSVNQSM